MRAVSILLVLCFTSTWAVPKVSQKIVGGSLATISQYPYTASLLYSWNSADYVQLCAGTILTTTAVLSAASCFYGDVVSSWRVRVGSSYANSDGTVHVLRAIFVHSGYTPYTMDNDVSVLRTTFAFVYKANAVAPASIAGPDYVVEDSQLVWAVGWGSLYPGGPASEQLREVQILVVNHNICKTRYAELGYNVTDNMLCSGWLNVGGRDQCTGDAGGPLIHNGVIVGIFSWNFQCALARYPGVNTKVSQFTTWIKTASGERIEFIAHKLNKQEVLIALDFSDSNLSNEVRQCLPEDY